MYSGKRPLKIPLSENKEFKSIKNRIIKEASSPNYNTNVKIHSYPNGNRVSASTVTRLFKNLCNIFRDKFDDENRRTIYTPAVDKRIRREDEAKRNAELIYD